MNTLFELLFLAWCPPYDPAHFPEYLQNDPIRAYGQYAFQEGFQLALCLTVSALLKHGDTDI